VQKNPGGGGIKNDAVGKDGQGRPSISEAKESVCDISGGLGYLGGKEDRVT